MDSSSPVLVTGSSGRVGRAAVNELLRRGHAVREFDLTPTPGLADCITGDLADRAAIDRAMRGIHSLIHLAATPDDADFLTELLPNNITGLYHVMESALAAGVRRIVLASSGQVNWWQQKTGPFPIRPEDPVSPKHWYAATKMFMEAIGRSFVEIHGISVIIARLGWCPRTREQVEEIAASELYRDVYFSPGDVGRFFACAIEAPAEVRHAIVYGASRPVKQARFDMSSAARLLGYEPVESWPQGVEIITGSPWPGQ
jgi:uronate dehydrogenase